MTTTEVRSEPRRPDPRPHDRSPDARGALVLAGAVLLLWGLWLLVPETARLDLLGGGRAAPAVGAVGAEESPQPGAGRGIQDAVAPAGPAAALPGAPAGEQAGQGEGPADPSAGLTDPSDPAADPAADPADADAGPADELADEPAAGPVEVPKAGDGSFAVAPGTGATVGEGDLVRYSVEVEGGVPLDPGEVAEVVDQVLADPRSWTGQGRWALQRVDAAPDARIVIASPDTSDRLCAPLRTNGELSCRNGDDVVLNALRWTQGTETWGDDVEGYRQYLVNHELGHYLGHGHVSCPAAGQPAPVMLQQTLGLQGCLANAWPYP